MALTSKKLETKIKKWGNSLAVRLPVEVISALDLADGSGVRINIDENSKKVTLTKELNPIKSLADLVSKINPHNMHAESDWGRPEGKEVW